MSISAQDVKKLRDATSLGFGECKKALVETEGDFDAAIKYLREKGLKSAAKKADREATEGLIAAATTDDGKTGALVEVNCETDFVAKNDTFKAFVTELAGQALDHDDGALGEATKDTVSLKIQEIGENLIIGGNVLYKTEGAVATYIHPPGKIGVMVEFETGKPETGAAIADLGKMVCMHIAATNPDFLSRDDVDPAVIEEEKSVYAKQLEGKPAEILDKIIGGKIDKFYSTICLLEQKLVMDPDNSVGDTIAAKAKDLGDTVTLKRFVRKQIG